MIQEVDFDVVIGSASGKYRIAGQAMNHDSFTLRIINEDYTKRWAGTYSANYINDITQKAGCVKKISVFWKMLVNAVKNQNPSVTLEIFTDDEMLSFSHSRVVNDHDPKLYILLTQTSDYDCFKYPLPVPFAAFTYEEYAETIKLLYEDNKNLQKSLAASDCTMTVLSLEEKLEEYTQVIEQLRKQKDLQIATLKRKVKNLKAKIEEKNSRSFYTEPPKRKAPRSPR